MARPALIALRGDDVLHGLLGLGFLCVLSVTDCDNHHPPIVIYNIPHRTIK